MQSFKFLIQYLNPRKKNCCMDKYPKHSVSYYYQTQKDKYMKKILGFSLVELMISLIVISIVTAAFAPIVTKKLKTSDMSIGTGSSDYVFDEAICSASVQNCSICVADSCVKCKEGYYLDENECKACTDSCLSCTNSSKCLKCKDGFYPKDDKCKACSDNLRGCKQCSKDGTQCLTCVDNCEICHLTKGCLKCKIGNHYDGKECTACSYEDSIYELGSYKIYRYNVGDECGPPIPRGINVCYQGESCPYDYNTPLCIKSTNTSFMSGHIQEAGYYYPDTRTTCNWYAMNIARTMGHKISNPQTWSTLVTSFAMKLPLQLCAGYGIAAGECSQGYNARNGQAFHVGSQPSSFTSGSFSTIYTWHGFADTAGQIGFSQGFHWDWCGLPCQASLRFEL